MSGIFVIQFRIVGQSESGNLLMLQAHRDNIKNKTKTTIKAYEVMVFFAPKSALALVRSMICVCELFVLFMTFRRVRK